MDVSGEEEKYFDETQHCATNLLISPGNVEEDFLQEILHC